MSAIQYIIGDATAPSITGNKIICHVCNDIGGWGKGFVLALSKRWPEPEAAYRAWHRDREHNDFALGAVQLVPVEQELWVANMIGQHNITRKGVTKDGLPPIRYEAIESALAKVAEEVGKLTATVHMPRIGCGLAGGTWDRIEPIVQRTLGAKDIEIFVYDLVPNTLSHDGKPAGT
jgi:O-acetyl-ADP-ribose deacetylase (regulator of RNase III)